VFAVVSRRGVIEPGLIVTLLLSLVCLLWGDVDRVVMVTGTGYLAAMMTIHFGLWLQRKQPESRWGRWSLGFLGVEGAVLVIGGLAWSWQDLLMGLLLPFLLGFVVPKLSQLKFAPFHPNWWLQRYQRQSRNLPISDWVAFQVTTLIVLVCGAVSIGWFVHGRLERSTVESNAGLFSILLLVVTFVAVAIACWTSLPQIAAITEAHESVEHALDNLQRTQMQLVQAEKMSSLGQLVAGIAHEINNPVNFIYGNLSHVREYAQDLLTLIQLYEKHYPNPVAEIQAEVEAVELDFLRDDLVKTLESMKMGTDRIRQIVLSLRNFSRMDEAEVKAVDIHEGIDSTLLILQHRLKANAHRPEIGVIKDYGDLPGVECYPGQLNQVVMNILANAIDALDEASVNRTYQDMQTNPNQIFIRTVVNESQSVQITIADNGPGIPDAIQPRIFDPFFTTKPVGKGTGMGMSISYQIITEKHQGKLLCFSEVGIGTEFHIEIPIQQNLRSNDSDLSKSGAILSTL